MDGIPLGPILLRWNGLLIMLGFALGGILATREIRRRGGDPEIILDLVLPMLVWGTIGARLAYVLTPPHSSVQLGLTTRYYLTHILDLVAIWTGGLSFPGAILGGMLGLFIFCRRNRLIFSEWADILAPSLAFGEAVGRFGNYINQELYGIPTRLPWKIIIDSDHRLAGYESVESYHPLFAYAILSSLAILFFLKWISRRFADRFQPGSLFLIYLMSFSTIRFFIEFLRLDVSTVGGTNINQVLLFAMLLTAGVFLYRRNRIVQ